jgi:hypothetical protein
MGVQKHYKKRFTKDACRKVFTKNRQKKTKTSCFSILFDHVFGHLPVSGEKKHEKNQEKQPTTSRPVVFVFEVPSCPAARLAGRRGCEGQISRFELALMLM